MKPISERFWEKVEKTDGCWLWRGHVSPEGYGKIWGGRELGIPTGAHRVSYEIHKGEIPKGMVVMHSCDNRGCCNPDHLSLGTDADNARDKVAKGRHSFGARRYNAKLDDAKVRHIRTSPEIKTADFVRMYGVSQSVITNARNGVTWRHVA